MDSLTQITLGAAVGEVVLGKKIGNQPLDDSIMELVTSRMITPELAYEKAINKEAFVGLLKKQPDDIFL